MIRGFILAFFMNPQLMLDEEEIMPSFWWNNYFSFSAKESMIITVSCPQKKLIGRNPKLVDSGWNVEKMKCKSSK